MYQKLKNIFKLDLKQKLIYKEKMLRDLMSSTRFSALMDTPEDLKTQNLIYHAVNKKPDIAFDSQSALWNEKRINIIERLQLAYKKSSSDYKEIDKNNDLWTEITDTNLKALIDAIENMSPENLSRFMLNFGSKFTWFGGITTSIDGYTQDKREYYIALTYFDMLVSVAEYLGVIPNENPESYKNMQNIQIGIDEIIEKINQELKISIEINPNIIHTDGVKTQNGLIHYRHILGLYGAIRIKELSSTDAPCCEIGGGLGFTAYYCSKMGVKGFHLYDLPITNFLSGHFLMNALGTDAVTLYGEKAGETKIKIYPYWDFFKTKQLYDITINQDSLNEIDHKTIQFYIDAIPKRTKKYFLSINHETYHPKTVHNLLSKNKNFKKVAKSRFWLRKGYIEELFKIR